MATNRNTDTRDATRRAAVEMLAEGLATHAEVARLAGVDRQLVRHWATRAQINVVKTRAARLREIWLRKLGKHR
jgi:transposase-like protein